jgi:hypothetical protein
MTPEQRLQACVELSALAAELHRQGEIHRSAKKSSDSPPSQRVNLT